MMLALIFHIVQTEEYHRNPFVKFPMNDTVPAINEHQSLLLCM